MNNQTDILIIGAGPFGLAIAGYCHHHDLDYLVVGKRLEFWQDHMPEGMLLRSASDWHLDPEGIHTIEEFLTVQNKIREEVEPLPRDFYLSYLRWFEKEKQIQITEQYVTSLTTADLKNPRFIAKLDNDQIIEANRVVVAVGFKYFKYEPNEVTDLLPVGSFSHTCDHVDFADLKGMRVLVLGGRQSAFEWTALLNEAGVKKVHVAHRHDSPSFTEADWSWTGPLVDAIVDNPGWYRNLSQKEKDDINHRLWAEGRLKVEPWLESRVKKDSTKIWPNTQVEGCSRQPGGDLMVKLDNGEKLIVDHIILATGYKVNIRQLPFLSRSNIFSRLKTRNRFPVLDEHFQTSIPGLYITSMAATQDFGPFFAFTLSARTSAKLIGKALLQ